MTIRGMANRANQALNSVTKGNQYGGSEQSGSWPTARELEPGFATIAPVARDPDLWSGEDLELGQVLARSDRNDTIPSPPPELESAPWHDER